MYKQKQSASTPLQKKYVIRDIAVIELLFATGLRISELCSLKPSNIDLQEQNILIYGKGSKERRLQIGNDDVIAALKEYQLQYQQEIQNCNYFFVN